MKQVMYTPSVNVYLGDCLTFLQVLSDDCVDAVITDPPYNVGVEYGSSDDRRVDYAEWCRAWFRELKRVCRGPILITTGTVNLGMWYAIERPRWVLCWHKPATMGRSPIGFCNWEPVLLYGELRGRGGCDVFDAAIRPSRSLSGHPCPKPLRWARRQIEMMTLRADTVLDPFLGSGTVAVACVQLRRKFVGAEIDPGYCKMACDRIRKAVPEFSGGVFGRLSGGFFPDGVNGRGKKSGKGDCST